MVEYPTDVKKTSIAEKLILNHNGKTTYLSFEIRVSQTT